MEDPTIFHGQVCSPHMRFARWFIKVRRYLFVSRRWVQYSLSVISSCCSCVLLHLQGGKSSSFNSVYWSRPTHNSPSKYSSGDIHRTSMCLRKIPFRFAMRSACRFFLGEVSCQTVQYERRCVPYRVKSGLEAPPWLLSTRGKNLDFNFIKLKPFHTF